MPATPRQLVQAQVALGDLALSPDGSLVAYTRRTVHENAYRTHLWVVPIDGGAARQLTRGAVQDAAPSFAVDGRLLFLRSHQVWAIDVDGGEAEQLTSLPHGASAFRIAPDGRRLALRGGAAETRFAVGELKDGEAPLARRIARVDWRLDGAGIVDRHEHLWLAPARPGGRARQHTRGDWSLGAFDWSPDGRQLVFSADRRPDADLLSAPSLHVVDARGGEPRELASLPGLCRTPVWSPDGRHVAFRGVETEGVPEDAPVGVFVVAAAGGAPRQLAAPAGLSPMVTFGSDLEDWELGEGVDLVWDGPDALLCPATERGTCSLWRFPLDGQAERVADDQPHLLRYAARAGRIVTLACDAPESPEVVALMPRCRRLTRDGGWLARRAPVEQRELEIPGPGGPITTWILAPQGAGDARLPTVLSIHGGPTGTWSPLPWLPDVALAASGYRVLRPDPRGSDSYGSAWLGSIMGSWGGADADDCLAVCDWAVANGLADEDRLAVFGLSYGGFLTQWLIGRTERFRAAVAANGVANQVSCVANCDLGVPWTFRLGWGQLPGSAETLWSQSPLANVDRIHTPLLMLQGEADLRCPPSDNEQLFVALRTLRRPVEYVLYPGESHLMQATGRPDRRIDMLERTLAWLAGHGVTV
jgi:dipeptidyl aminopeptidase/acylaminoacyl peptidase